MTTKVVFSSGEETTYREGIDAHPSTGDPGVTVVHREWLHPNDEVQETAAQKRDRLRAELAALDDDEAAAAEAGT